MLCLLSARGVSAQETALSFSQYSVLTYEWVDAQGTTHTSSITDVATDPYQIVALLRFAYCDPRVPGPYYNGYAQDGTTRENEVYYGANAGGWDISSSDVQLPNQEGYTIFLVCVKNSATPISDNKGSGNNTYSEFDTRAQLVEYIGSQIDSVRLLTDGMRVGDGMNRGTVYNYTGTLNRFFLLSKGQSRQNQTAYKSVPFERMFEQFSPTDGTEGSQTADFYQKMAGGEGYPVQHDCASVLQARHYFAMSGLTGTTAYALDGLNFSIPDYRMMRGSGNSDPRDMNSSGNWKYAKYGMYNKEHQPETMVYNINLSATAEILNEGQCNVTLTWQSSIDKISSTAIPQLYYVYRVVTDDLGHTTYQLLDVIENQPFINTEEGYYNNSTRQNSYTYTVDRSPSSYEVSYIVQGRPEPDYRFKLTYSNEATAVIPGVDPLEALDLKINGNYVSVYDVNREVNKYDNYITVSNGLVYKIKLAHLNGTQYSQGTTDFKLYRCLNDPNESDNPSKTHVGTLRITKRYNNNWGWNNDYYSLSYNFIYVNDTQRSGANHGTTSGSLSGRYDNSDEVNFGNIQFSDMFEVSTATNEHPNRYYYVLEVETGAVVANGESRAHSNVIAVPVYKTEIDMSGNQYTKEQVDGDVDRGLDVKEGKVAIDVEAHPERVIYRYDIMRGLNGNTPNTYVAYAQHTEDGSYQPMNSTFVSQGDKVGNGNEVVDVTTYDETMTTSAVAKYLPVVEVYRPDGTMENKNTYGAPMKEVAFGVVNVTEQEKGRSEYSWEENGVTYAYYNLVVRATADVPEGYSLYKFRAWRLCDDVKEKLEEYKYRESTDFLFDEISDINPDYSWVDLGATAVSVDDHVIKGTFGAKVPAAGEFLDVDVIVRLYYKKNTTNASHHLLAEGGDYYIAQKTVSVKMSGTPTGVIGVAYSGNPVNVVYYNMLGVASDTPYPGVNIIVTTYEDGSKSTVKKIVK